jgi:hypothetical protein
MRRIVRRFAPFPSSDSLQSAQIRRSSVEKPPSSGIIGTFFSNTFGLHHRLSGTVTFGGSSMSLQSETETSGFVAYGHKPATETQNAKDNMKTEHENGTESSKSNNWSMLWLAGLMMMVTLGRILGSNH